MTGIRRNLPQSRRGSDEVWQRMPEGGELNVLAAVTWIGPVAGRSPQRAAAVSWEMTAGAFAHNTAAIARCSSDDGIAASR
ncbi:MAG TPA: hypothetical protein VHI71_10040 [Actinomycetota bacterium]|nr:hypothetical protein [Actinomycetota bacterium]